MLRRDRWIPALLSTVLFAMPATLAMAATQIGVAASIKPNADRVVGAKAETLAPGSELHANETVRTGNLGQADLVFIDKTNLTVGPASEVRLDKFVYDPTGSSGQGCDANEPRRIPVCHRLTRAPRLSGHDAVRDAWGARHGGRNGHPAQKEQTETERTSAMQRSGWSKAGLHTAPRPGNSRS